MQDTIRRLVKLTAGYSIVTLLGPLFTIFLTPLYTRVLSPADYGVVDIALTLSGFLTLFAILGLDQALSAYFFDGEGQYRRDLVTTAIVSVGSLGAIFGIAVAVLAVPLAQFFFKNTGYSPILYLLAINAVSVPIYSVVLAALRLQMAVGRVNTLGLTLLLATALSNITLVLVFHFKATGVVAANVIANAIACIVGLLLAYTPFLGRLTFPIFKPLIRAGLGLLPGAVSFLLLSNIDRLILTQYVSQADIGLYSIANKLASMLYVLLSAVWNAWWPMALEMAGTPGANAKYARMLEYFVAVSLLLALVIGLFAPEILAIFTSHAYVAAAPYALLLLISSGPVGFLTSFFYTGLYVKKRTSLISLTFILAALVNILLNLALNPIIGVWGAVWGTVLSSIVLMLSTYFTSQRVYPIEYHFGRIAALVVVYAILVAFALATPFINASLLIKAGAVLLFLLSIMATGIVSYVQIAVGLGMMRSRLLNVFAGNK